jgi:hypothetical protein
MTLVLEGGAMKADGIPEGHPYSTEERPLDRCERCASPMTARIISFFTEEFICMDCLQRERELLLRLKTRRVSPSTLAGSGELPTLFD